MAGDVLAILTATLSSITLAWTIASFAFTRGRLSAFEERTLRHQREFAVRDQHWRELTGAIDYALGISRASQTIGLTILRHLAAAAWVTNDDRLKVAAVLAVIEEG